MGSDDSISSASAPPKSKQERIRDNQRRSRARRQEYLADLERRLKESHVACREAELQRSAFAELQVENARLRDLLNYAGVSPEVVEGFSRQNMSRQSVDAVAVAHRQIRPKFQPPAPIRLSTPATMMRQMSTSESHCPTTTAASPFFTPATALTINSPNIYGAQHTTSFMAAPSTEALSFSSTTSIPPASSYSWTPGSETRTPTPASFCCDAFSVPPNGPLLTDDGNTIQCSMAKLMIEEYSPTPSEMEEIKARLATGFSLPRPSEPGCRVSTQLLFSILQDMNTRDLRG